MQHDGCLQKPGKVNAPIGGALLKAALDVAMNSPLRGGSYETR